METKSVILKTNKVGLEALKWSTDLDKSKEFSFVSDCSNCGDYSECSECQGNGNGNINCIECSFCKNCSNCYLCRNADGLQYAICNVEMSKEEYEKKMAELGVATVTASLG